MTEYLSYERRGCALVITLDRPKALNALNTDMCAGIHRALSSAEADPDIAAVVLQSSSARAYCAGGDIKGVRQSWLDGDTGAVTEFFSVEYAMNSAMAAMTTPVVALLSGAVMGGGLGISIHGSHRIVDTSVTMAMPETAIGFIPDVGASYFLPRLCGGGTLGVAVGRYLGMTGARLSAADALYSGLGTHLISDGQHNEFANAVCDSGVESALEQFGRDPDNAGLSTLRDNIELVDEAFGAGTPMEVIDALTHSTTQFAQDTLAAVEKLCPSSVSAAFYSITQGVSISLEQCLANEQRLGAWCIARADFAEGVRAVLIDKDHKPRWNPQNFDEVDSADITAQLRH